MFMVRYHFDRVRVFFVVGALSPINSNYEASDFLPASVVSVGS